MSNLKVNTINDASGGSNAVLYGVAAPVNSMGFRNRIINGDMQIDQRNAGASVTSSPLANVFCVDRWFGFCTSPAVFTMQQSTDTPAGFVNSVAITVTTQDTSLAAGDFNSFRYIIEGLNVADFGWGTASAQPITFSFWVKSSLTGTFSVGLRNSALNRSYIATYTISTANTWEQKTVTIAGDTSGTWLTTNGVGIRLDWSLGSGSDYQGTANSWTATNDFTTSGSVSVVGTNGATFYITGVQLEAGSVASPFERRDYGRELMMCQRYCVLLGGSDGASHAGAGVWYATTATIYQMRLPVEMRASPALTNVSPNLSMYYSGAIANATAPTINTASKSSVEFYTPVSSGSGTAGQGTSVRYLSGKSLLTAEL